MLAEIKSRMLLPRVAVDAEDEDDPRASLIRRLQEYERFKRAAEDLDRLPRLERDVFVVHADSPELVKQQVQPQVDLREVLVALARVLHRAEMFERHAVQLEPLSVRDRMSEVLSRVNEAPEDFVAFVSLFNMREGRLGVVVTFLAIMELIRERLIDIVQTEQFAPIYVRAASA
jgi:segregation and condensation protein A